MRVPASSTPQECLWKRIVVERQETAVPKTAKEFAVAVRPVARGKFLCDAMVCVPETLREFLNWLRVSVLLRFSEKVFYRFPVRSSVQPKAEA
jgi:hypothetical protein